MEVIENTMEPAGVEMTRRQQFIERLRFWLLRLSRWFPRLVWINDEVDISIHFEDIGALGGDPSEIFRAQELFYKMGITFDTGSGCGGRDWEWDWSLRGPVHLKFRGRAKHLEKRCPKEPLDIKVVS